MQQQQQQQQQPPRETSSSPPSSREAAAVRATGWGLSYSARLMLTICGLVLCTSTLIVWLAHRRANAGAEALARSLFREVSGHAVTRTRAFIDRAVPLVRAIQHLAGEGLAMDDSDRLARQLHAIFTANDGLSWISFGDERGTFTGVYRTADGTLRVNQSRIDDGRTRLREHDVLSDGSWSLSRQDDDSGYDPRTRPFYLRARETNRIVWMPPYVFYDQGILGISCAAPVHDRDGRLQGVVSVDFDLNVLSDFVAGLTLSPNAKVFIFSDDGNLIAYPGAKTQQSIRGRRNQSAAPTALDDADDPIVEVLRRGLRPAMASSRSSDAFRAIDFEVGGQDYFASTTTFRPSDDLAWAVGAIAPRSDFLSGVWRGQHVSLAIAGIAVLAAVLAAAALARRVSGPIVALISFMRRVGTGDLQTEVSFSGSSEFAEMAQALNRMIAELRDRLRLRHSLSVAMQVQQRLLPQRPPQVRDLDVAGHSTYCDETGGDYYDFLILDETRPNLVLVAIGDVMGHGVAAALVMAGVRAVLRDRAAAEPPGALADLMGRLNRLISADHEGHRFMTMHLSLIDARTGTFRWVSAGHDPAMIYDPVQDRFDEIDLADLPLGIVSESGYEEHHYGPLRPAQVIIIGTDGIWETADVRGELFGKERLRAVIREAASLSAADIVRSVRERLADFRGDGAIVDDVTFVVLKFTPAPRPLFGGGRGGDHSTASGQIDADDDPDPRDDGGRDGDGDDDDDGSGAAPAGEATKKAQANGATVKGRIDGIIAELDTVEGGAPTPRPQAAGAAAVSG